MNGIWEGMSIIFVIFLYFLPTCIASANKKQNVSAIFLLNLLLGWTIIGWIGALIWAMCNDKEY